MLFIIILGFGILYAISEHKRDVAESRLRELNAEREPLERWL